MSEVKVTRINGLAVLLLVAGASLMAISVFAAMGVGVGMVLDAAAGAAVAPAYMHAGIADCVLYLGAVLFAIAAAACFFFAGKMWHNV